MCKWYLLACVLILTMIKHEHLSHKLYTLTVHVITLQEAIPSFMLSLCLSFFLERKKHSVDQQFKKHLPDLQP